MSFTVDIKHAGKTHNVEFNPVQDALAFKNAIYTATGVPVDRMKVMVKGGILKDNADMVRLAIKQGQSITVIGTAGPLPTAPVQKATFLEDLPSDQVPILEPPGLVNNGNTCYLSATLQALRTIPSISEELAAVKPVTGVPNQLGFTKLMNMCFNKMGKQDTSVDPVATWVALGQMAPQFTERDPRGMFMQQDADEAWTEILSALRTTMPRTEGSTANTRGSFVDDDLSADMLQTMVCDEAPTESPTQRTEKVLKLDCNIGSSTNYMINGIKGSLDQKIEKHSQSLGRTAVYTQTSRLARLPVNLTVHMVRFYWRVDISKKAKIMRKVKFPFELDVSELLTDDLAAKFKPVNLAIKNIDKARVDRVKIAKKQKKIHAARSGPSSGTSTPIPAESNDMEVEVLESEDTIRQRERKEVEDLIAAQGDAIGPGENRTGLYDLSAIVTHKGASGDSGHYIGWTRISGEEGVVPGEEDWWKFDDEKVTRVPWEKIQALEGGGEDSVAYILLYKSKLV